MCGMRIKIYIIVTRIKNKSQKHWKYMMISRKSSVSAKILWEIFEKDVGKADYQCDNS